ncbi:helix-turn-helix domain-containing protein [Pseudomonas haemolytica]|uniref:Helix-turn-helix transcriptional regulator n=1 Tax=Pseudomonas haemolytica TaxID=2600065 RepID=A0A5P1DK88_9PSED|nr:helix-turn-helix domain-containing protein [Pseudomonas haemolytica]MBJ2247817.1 helix-turn-helix transcriptional regulator [Pseudomonas haemolytica]MBJ2275439.1 helix-turn-helix transcriptional regulator [Pseudomonas haemolytica]MBK3450522.1 helix-turn-helix transcriptional regulator [Pseudomonas haemolytica]MBK3462233.1 helix-turn-helix transcriptional regulator [Pseudomonas haemolytica]MRJ40029.1 helix-turn-helix transcriptional regulator [Pseudomonas haemolytica]
MKPEWSGRLWLGRDYGLILGELGRTAPHAHYAHQLMLSPHAPITVSLDGHVTTAHRLFIPSRHSHAILETEGEVWVLYAEPMVFDTEPLQQLLVDGELSPQALHTLPRRRLDDPRIERALATLDRHLGGKVSAQALAAAAHLSLSQLERLFTDQLGLPVRRLVLWRRLRIALQLALAGSTLTEAAHGAGFADSAHFSRTMKQLFGVTAGASLRQLQVQFLA